MSSKRYKKSSSPVIENTDISDSEILSPKADVLGTKINVSIQYAAIQ